MTGVSRRFLLGAALALLACKPSTAAESPAPAKAAFGKVQGAPDTKHWMNLPAQGNAQVLSVEAGVAGDRIAALLEVPETECAVLIARGTATVDDVDLFAYGEDGAALGSDEGSDKAPALLVCPPHPRRVYVSARIAAGHGLVAIGAQRVAVKDAEKAAALYNVRHRPGEIARRLSVWPGLDEELEQHRRSIGARWVDVRRVAVPLDSRMPTRASASVEGERCLDVFVLPSDDVGYLEVTVLDERGSIVGRAPTAGRNRNVIVCSPVPAGVTVEIRPHAGMGLSVLMLSRTSEGSEIDLDPRAPRFDLFPMGSVEETRQKTLQKQGRGRRVASGTLSVGRRDSSSFDLPRGCHRVDVIGGTPLRGVEAWLWSDSGTLVANERGGARAALYACTRGGKVRLDVEALARGGPFAVEVTPEPDAPAVLFEHPLAASRLVARMVARGLIEASPQIGAVHELSVSATKLASVSVKVPIGRCLEVNAAIDTGASGLELRALSSNRGEELALVRGSTSAATRLCALRTGETLEAKLEVRVLSGAAEALLATRLIDPR